MSTTISRRERNKAEKRERILCAASDLFSEQGYAATATQAVAARADVAVGTVFQYAATKPELLMMVVNERLGQRLGSARTGVARIRTPHKAVLALAEPLLALVSREPENLTAYVRELIFGEPGPHHDAGLGLVSGLERAIGETLTRTSGGGLREGIDEVTAGRAVLSSLLLELNSTRTGRDPRESLEHRLRTQVELSLHGVLAP
ncbi:TetR family transcriptional regulator [Actinomycetota bacterium]